MDSEPSIAHRGLPATPSHATSPALDMRQRTIKLRDGSSVLLRPISADDKDLLVRGFERLSPDSRYRRFLTPVPELSPSQLTYLTDVDHHDHEALVAIESATGELLGVARYVRSAHRDAAEVAVAVADDWHGRGLGRALLEHLADRARAEGVRCFSAVMQGDNVPVMRLLEHVGDAERSHEGPYAHVHVELPQRGIGPQLADLLRTAAAGSAVVAGTLLHRAAIGARPVPQPPPPRRPRAIRTIVAGTDGSSRGGDAVEAALELGRLLGSRVHLVSAFNPRAHPGLRDAAPAGLQSLRWVVFGREEADAALRAAMARAHGVEPTVHARPGDPAEVLIDAALQEDADLIVVGSKGMADKRRFLLGSVADRVAHHAPCSVMIVRNR